MSVPKHVPMTRLPLLRLYPALCILVLVATCFHPSDARARTKPPLRVTPSCAEAGDSVFVEVNVLPREYSRNVIHRVYFDWAGVQDTAIFAENVPNWTPRWSHRVKVPSGAAPGTHSIRFEQVEITDDSGLATTACAYYLNFQVADTSGMNPWRDTLTVVADDDTMFLRFDPTNLCGIPRCDVIHLIQTIRATGLDTLSHVRNLSYDEQGFAEAALLDSERTVAGWRVDVRVDAVDPFYTEKSSVRVGAPGRSGDTTVVAFMRDAPHRHLNRYPGDIQAIILEFEVCAVCAQGEGIGAFLGRYLWRWARPRAGPETITGLGGTREPPSAQFEEALDLWRSRHAAFDIPVTGYPIIGGTPCQ